MSKFKSKLARRIVAIVLAGAMVMSSMTSSNMSVTGAGTAYAAELTTEESVEDVEDIRDDVGGETDNRDVADENNENQGDDENTPEESEPGENKPEESEPGENKPEESKPSESKPEESKPEESKPAESTPEESSSVENSSVEASSVESSSEPGSDVEESGVYELDLEDLAADYGVSSTDSMPDKAAADGIVNGLLLGKDVYFTAFDKEVDDPTDSTKKFTGVLKFRKAAAGFYMDIPKWGSGGIEFTVSGTANVVVEASSSGSTSYSPIALMYSASDDESAVVKTNKEGLSAVIDTSRTTLTYENLQEGKYTLLSPYDADKNRGVRIFSIKVTEKDATRDERAAFSSVSAPTITSAVNDSENEGHIKVTVSGKVGYDGGDKLTVIMTDADGVETTKVSRVGKNSHTFDFTPEASGDYTFSAKLSRGSEDKSSTETSKVEGFVLPIGKATVTAKANDDNSIDVTWTEVKEADSYVVTIKEKDAAETAAPIDTKTVTVEEGTELKVTFSKEGGFAVGTYTVSVVAKRDENSGEAVTRDVEIKASENPSGGKTYELDVTDLGLTTITAGQIEQGKGTDGFFDIYFKASGASSLNTTTHTFDDGYEGKTAINFGGNMDVSHTDDNGQMTKTTSAIKFTTEKDTATVTIWWRSGGTGTRTISVYDETNNPVAVSEETGKASSDYFISEIKLTGAGTYYVGPKGGSSNIYKIKVVDGEEVKEPTFKKYALDVDELGLTTITTGQIEQGKGTDGFFDIYFKASGASSLNTTTHTFDDGYEGKTAINFGGNMDVSHTDDNGQMTKTTSAIKFTTEKDTATVTIWWRSGGTGTRTISVYDETNNPVAVSEETGKASSDYFISEIKLTGAGTYYVGPKGGSSNVYKIEVIDGELGGGDNPEPDAPVDWENVAVPTITAEYDDTYGARTGVIKVTVNAVVFDPKTEKVTVHMYDMSGKEVGTAKDSTVKKDEHTFEFSPTYTSTYTFDAVLSRAETNEDGTVKKDENGNDVVLTKKSQKTAPVKFTLPLAAPKILDYVNMGEVEGSDPKSGSVELSWSAVEEATGYCVVAVDAEGKEVFNSGVMTGTSLTIREALEIGKLYTFSVMALRDYTGENNGLEQSEKGSVELEVKAVADTFEPGKYILETGLLEVVNKPNAIEKTGKYIADQNAADVIAKQPEDADGGTAMNATVALVQSFADTNYFTIMYGSNGRVQADNNGGKGREYPNNYFGSNRIAMGGTTTAGTVPTSAAIKFKTSAASRVDVYWRLSSNADRGLQLLDANGNQLGVKMISTNTQFELTSFFIDDPGTYYLGSVNGEVCIARVVVCDGYEKKERPEWTTDPVEGKDNVTAPAITEAALKEGDNSTIVVKATADIGPEASADGVTVYMTYKDENGEEQVADYKSSTAEGTEHTFEFTPDNSNKYFFSAKMTRTDEETTIDSVDKDAEGNDIRKSVDFILPLGNVTIKSVTNKGKADDNYGIIEAVWSHVEEAVYEIEIKDNTGATVYKKIETGNLATINKKDAADENSGWQGSAEGLVLNAEYTLNVTAMRAKPAAEGAEVEYERTVTATESFTVTGKNTTTWTFSNFGSRANIKQISGTEAGCGDDSLIDTDPDFGNAGKKVVQAGMKRNDYLEILDENDNPKKVRVWSIATYGKIVPNSTDGVALYYTSVDPSHYNFRLSADVHVDQWTISNGQDGFGVLAFDQVRDTVGSDTDEGGDVWNNSYMAVATKMEYRWDEENQKVSNAGTRASLRLGIGSIARTGVTAENISEFNNNNTVSDATKKYFRSVSKPLDTQVHDNSIDNLIGNITNPTAAGNTISPAITDLRMEIELNDTGYFVSYTPITVNPETREVISVGEKATNKFYDRNALSQIDKDYVYPGFFAARNVVATFSNIEFTTTPYDAANAHPEQKEVEYIAPNYSIVSASTSNSEDYLLTYEANWHGKVIIRNESGDVILSEDITGSPELTDKAELPVKLHIGDNTFQATFEPDASYDPYDGDPLTRLENYDAKTDLITVTYKKYGLEGQALYVAPQGKATGDGTQKNPLDIYTAVRYVQPGQTIYLMDGTYDLSRTIRVERGTDGTKENPIRMVPAEAGSRPVFDFHNACEGMILAGDHWYFYGFDVTRSSDGNNGIRVCGDYNTLDSINAYKNGNTGIGISRLLSSDMDINTDWPKYNTIKNCTSYLNADGGYEDADGFACKLTSGVGNKFIGCVAAYNADDGWDFYAKVETGPIGMVTIENCVAYKNGYVLRADNGNGELAWYGEAENVAEVNAGNGNGFKMGGSSISGYHTLKNSLAFYNKSKGFDSNSCPDIQVYNSITFNNESYNVAFYSNASTTDFAARGLISYRTDALKVKDENEKYITLLTGMEDRIGQKTSANDNYSSIINTQQKGMNKIFNGTNFFWNQYIGKSELDSDFVQNYTTYYTKKNDDGSYETPPVYNEEHTVKDDWFENVDFDSWFGNLIKESEKTGVPHVVDRNANGTINVGNFLKLTDKAGKIDAGLPDLGESTDENFVSKNPEDFAGVDETNGIIDKGNSDDEISSSVDPEDLKQKPGSAIEQVGLWFAIVDKDEIGYTGKAVKPEIHVYYDNTLLNKKQYNIVYKNNVNAWLGNTETGVPAEGSGYESNIKKVPTISVRGRGNYYGQAKDIYFEIQPVNIGNDPQNRVSAPAITLLKANQAAKPVLTFMGRKLSDKKDYTPAAAITTENNKQWLEVTGKGNYTGSVKIEVRDASSVAKENLASSFKVDKIAPQYRRGYVTDYTGRIKEYLPVEPLTASMVTTKSGGALTLYDPATGEGDIMISYVNNIEIGTASAIITGMNNYYGTKEVKFKIIAPPVSTLLKEGNLKYIDITKLVDKEGDTKNYIKATDEITKIDSVEFAFDAAYPYQGKPIQWDNLAVAAKKADGKWYRLTSNTDYILSYRNNSKAGTASVVVRGIGNYTGSMIQTYKITPFDISSGTLGGTFAQTTDAEGNTTSVYFEGAPSAGNYGMMKNAVLFDKAGAKPSISIRVNGNLMRIGKDYTVAYKKNLKVGEATFTIRGVGGLTGTITGSYRIEKKPFNDPENPIKITATDVKLSSKDGNGFKGKNNTRIVVKDSRNRVLSLNKDYVIDRYEFVDNSTYTPTGETIADNKTEVRISSDSDYRTVKVTLKGAGDNYTDAELYTYYRITWAKNSLMGAKARIVYEAGGKDNPGLKDKYFYYKEGGAVTLNNDTLKLTLNGENLVFGRDYSVVSYSKNDKRGTAKLVIQGKGQYIETKIITFNIGAYTFAWWESGNSSGEEENPGTEESSSTEESSGNQESSATEETNTTEQSSETQGSGESQETTTSESSSQPSSSVA